MAKPQELVDGIWAKYRTSLTTLISTLEENDVLRKELDINLDMPEDIDELEKRVEDRLNK